MYIYIFFFIHDLINTNNLKLAEIRNNKQQLADWLKKNHTRKH